jgi:predicted Ser/Thr protein kinase
MSFVLRFEIFAILVIYLLLNCVNTQPQGSVTHKTAALSEGRYYLAATSSGELVFFGGGYNTTNTPSNRVDVCNVTSGSWTTATLSVPRGNLAATSSGNLVFFGGGWSNNIGSTPYNQVDIYNITNGSWSTATLSQARGDLAATSVQSLVLFGGGYNSSSLSNIVDIYNVTSNMWTATTLSQARCFLAATSVANRYVLFAGGLTSTGGSSNVVDIYDAMNGVWNTTTLSQARENLAATSLGNLSFFGGGSIGSGMTITTYNIVDIFNATSQSWYISTLSLNCSNLAAASFGSIVAFGGGMVSFYYTSGSLTVDMYDITVDVWSTTNLTQPRAYLAATSSTGSIFFGGGENSSGGLSNVVDIFVVSSASSPTPTSMPQFSSSPPFTLSSTSLMSLSSTYPAVSPYTSTLSAFPTLSPTSKVPAAHVNDSSIVLPRGAIIGIAVGAAAIVLGAGLILFLVLYTKKRRKQKHSSDRKDPGVTSIASVPKIAISNERTQYIAITSSRNQSTQTQGVVSIERSKSSVELTKKHLIPFADVKIERELGKGSYGKVYLGQWDGAPVALKFCKEKEGLDNFLKEANLMVELPPHPNVVQLFGISIDGPQPVLVLEYCAGGSLDRLLFGGDQPLDNKVNLVKGIARGMRHLHRHNIIHRDLAARNILLSSVGEPKISDFGMSRVLQQENEGQTVTNIGPIRWMAPESLANRVYSKKSDVWTFGIVVWDIVARREPHTDIDLLDIGPLIRDKGYTPQIPEDCPPILREIMELCWKRHPDERPTFIEICQLLDK